MSDPRTGDRRTIGAREAVPEATVADLGMEGRPGALGGTLSGEINPDQATGGVTRALDTPSAATGLWDVTPAEQIPPPPAARPAPTIAGYEIEGELGRGAMGVVYLARQVRLNRPCALKVILAGAHADPVAAVRFLGEAEAVARLQHPGIVQIHAIGEADGLPFLELEYVPGGSLDRTLDGSPWPARQAATLVEALTQAVVEAHRLGIVHRDLKPGNILIAADDTPKIADFGLAKSLNVESGLTATESILGTPSYMAPEQAEGKTKQIGPLADVYALGVILYELLVGRPPFRGTTVLETLEQVKTAEPVPPSRLVPGTPRDLETIALKCLQKDPVKRYSSAEALAEDLRRFLAGEPILARQTGPAERAWRWARRNPALASLGVSVILLLAALAVGSTLAAIWLNAERKKALDHLWGAYMAQAHAGRSSRQAGQRFTSLDVLGAAAQIRITDELRNEAIACLALVDVRPVRQFATIPHEDDGVAVDSAMERYALGDGEGNVVVYRVADGRKVVRLPRGRGPSRALGFSPDGRYLISAYSHRGIGWHWALWDIGGDEAPRKVMEPGNIAAIHFSPDGRRVAIPLSPNALGLYDPATGELRKRLTVAPMHGVGSFHPGGRRIMLVSPHRTLRLIDIESAKEVWSHSFDAEIDSMAWRGDGRLFAASGRDHRIYVWDMAADRLQSVLEGHQNTVVGLRFTSAGSLLISSSWDGGARVWDPIRGAHLLTLPGELLGLRPDDRQVVLRESDNRLGLWELADGRECRALHHGMVGNRTPRPEGWGPSAVDFSPDGRLLASSEGDGVRLWDPSTGTPIAHMPVVGVETLQFSPDGSHLLTQLFTGANIWPLRENSDGTNEGLRIGPARFLGTTRGLGLSTRDRASRYVTLTDYARSQAVVLDPANSAEVARLGPHQGLNQCPISPDGRWVATATWKGKDVKVWEVATGRLAWQLTCDSAFVNFSPDGRWLAVIEFPKPECRLWQVGSWKPGHTIQVSARSNVLAFSLDGRLLAIDGGGRVRLVAPKSGREVATLDAGTGSSTGFFCMAFSADGTKLAAGRDHIIHVWDLRRIREQLATMGLDWNAPPIPAAELAPASNPIRVHVEGADWFSAAAAGDNEARAGRWDAAAAAHARAVAEGANDPLIWQRHLLFRLRAGDLSGYRDGCAALNSRFQGEERPGFVEPVAWACSLGPDVLVDWASLISAMEAAVKQWPHDAELRKTLGAALVRAGRPRQAISALEESVRLNGHGGNAFDWLFLALAHHRLGHSERATAALAAARDWIAHGDERAIPDPYLWSPLRWYTKVELDLLLREAEGEITGASVDLPEAVFAPV